MEYKLYQDCLEEQCQDVFLPINQQKRERKAIHSKIKKSCLQKSKTKKTKCEMKMLDESLYGRILKLSNKCIEEAMKKDCSKEYKKYQNSFKKKSRKKSKRNKKRSIKNS